MYKVLLVEDDEMIVRMLQLRLEMANFQVETAENGLIGVKKALANTYDLVLMDMHMPIMDGHDAVLNLRHEGYSGLIVAVTASVMAQDADAALRAGCNDFITKPIEANFEQRILQLIQQHKTQ